MDEHDYSCSLPQCEIKSALNLPEVLVLPGEQNEIMVSMNDYVTISETDPDTLVTFGVTDCVVVALYNPYHGRYLAHLSRDVNNDRTRISNVCSSPDVCFECQSDEDKECVDEMYKANEHCYVSSGCIPCNQLDNTASFQESLPFWTGCPDTQAVLFSLGEPRKIYLRYLQLRHNGFGGKATIYIAPNRLEMIRSNYADSGLYTEEAQAEIVGTENTVENIKKTDKKFFTEFNLLNWYDIWKDTLPNPKTKKDVSIVEASGGVYLFDNKGQLKYFLPDDENKQNRAPYYNQYKNKYSGNDSRGWHCPYLLTSNYL